MAGIGESTQVAEKLVEAGKVAWDKTHTSLDLEIVNEPGSSVKVTRYTRYIADGVCVTQPDVTVEPGNTTRAVFTAAASKTRISGSLIYQLTHADTVCSPSRELYLLLAWKIKLGGHAHMMLDLLESRKDVISWNAGRLGEHYREYVKKQRQTAKGALTRTWTVENDEAFTVCVTTNGASAGSMKLNIMKATGPVDATKPFFVTPKKCDDIRWSTMEGTSTYNSPSTNHLLGSSIDTTVHNNCDDLLLCNASVDIFEGKRKSDYPGNIAPTGNETIRLKSKKTIHGATKACLLYELKSIKGNAPVVWGRRTFLAIDVIIVPETVLERKVAVQLLTVLDPSFPATVSKPSEEAHKEVLCHYMTTYGQPSEYRVDKMNLKVDLSFNREPHAKLHVRLSPASQRLKEGRPLFFAMGEHCTPSQATSDIIKGPLEKPNEHLQHRLRLCENKANGSGDGRNGFILEQLYPAKEEAFREFHAGCDDSRLRCDEAYLHSLPMLSDKQSDLYIYMIEPAAHSDSNFVCLLALAQSRDENIGNKDNGRSLPAHRYTAAVLYTPKRKGTDAAALAKHYLGHAKLDKDIQYGGGHLMDRAIQLVGKQAHLCVYQAVKPPHILTVSLGDQLNLKELYDANHSPPPSHTIRINVNSMCDELGLQLVDCISSGMPTSNVLIGAPSDDTFKTEFEFPVQDRQHAVLLRFRCTKDNSIGIDVHTKLSTLDSNSGESDMQQNTDICYVDANNKPIAELKPHKLESIYERPDEGSQGADSSVARSDTVQDYDSSAHASLPVHCVAIRHTNRDANLVGFDVCIVIASDSSTAQNAANQMASGTAGNSEQ